MEEEMVVVVAEQVVVKEQMVEEQVVVVVEEMGGDRAIASLEEAGSRWRARRRKGAAARYQGESLPVPISLPIGLWLRDRR
jgi:hypothetical protein